MIKHYDETGRAHEPITFKPGDSFSFRDEQGSVVLSVSFDMDPGSNLVTIETFDTEGHPIAALQLAYLGAGYPHCGAPGEQYYVNQVIRSTLPSTEPLPAVQGG